MGCRCAWRDSKPSQFRYVPIANKFRSPVKCRNGSKGKYSLRVDIFRFTAADLTGRMDIGRTSRPVGTVAFKTHLGSKPMALTTLSLEIAAGHALSEVLEIPPNLRIARIAMPDSWDADPRRAVDAVRIGREEGIRARVHQD